MYVSDFSAIWHLFVQAADIVHVTFVTSSANKQKGGSLAIFFLLHATVTITYNLVTNRLVIQCFPHIIPNNPTMVVQLLFTMKKNGCEFAPMSCFGNFVTKESTSFGSLFR